MKRSAIDRTISYIGLLLAAVFLIGSAVLYGTYVFIHDQVTSQLEPQNITLPAEDTASFTSLPESDQAAIKPFAGQQVLNGEQAKVFANNYIRVHLEKIGGGKSYSELSSASLANPSDTALAGQVSTVFRGETLRAILLNVYAFDTMAVVAKVVSFGALVAGIVLIFLSVLGFEHAKKAAKSTRKK